MWPSAISALEGDTSPSEAWSKNIQWLGQEFELARIQNFWWEVFGEASVASLKKPEETMALFARAVFLRNIADDLLCQSPDRTVELEQIIAMTRAINAWLDEAEGQSWNWSDLSNRLVCNGFRI